MCKSVFLNLLRNYFFWVLLVLLLGIDVYSITDKAGRRNDEMAGHETVYAEFKGALSKDKIRKVVSRYQELSEIVGNDDYSHEGGQPGTYTGYFAGDYGEFQEIFEEYKYRYEYASYAKGIMGKAAATDRIRQSFAGRKLLQHFDAPAVRWTYSLLPENTPLGDDVYQSVIGSRKPVLFIEGDGLHSIDSKLYPLVFRDYTVQSLGSCNKVIEATRTFNDLNSFHNMVSVGIVDRDRRDAHEVDYLRRKNVMVPEVAEVENILMLEEVIMAVAARHNRDGQRAVARVKKAIINQFAADLKQQALQHTRHRVKRTVEYRIDGRFTSINTLEKHVQDLWQEVNPRGLYEELCREFRSYVAAGDYAGVLRVYNQKSMLSTSNVAQLCGLQTKEQYIASVIKILRNEEKGAAEIRSAIMKCFNLEPQK